MIITYKSNLLLNTAVKKTFFICRIKVDGPRYIYL